MEIRKGDILLFHSHTTLGRIIQTGMNIQRWRMLIFKPFWKKISNHAAICIADGIIAEATAKGIVTHSLKYAYSDKKVEITVYRPKWNAYSLTLLYYAALRYRGTKYQFINFLQYIPKIFFGLWLGHIGIKANSRLYCTEYVARVLNDITNGRLFPKPWRTSPFGVQNWCESNIEKVGYYNYKTDKL